MRARHPSLAWGAIGAALLAGLVAGPVACQAVSGFAERERDESFDPDAEATLDVVFPEPDAPIADTALDTPGADAFLDDTTGEDAPDAETSVDADADAVSSGG